MPQALRYVLFYEMGPGGLPLAREHYPAHKDWFEEFVRRGVLLSLGPFSDPEGGSMAIFTTREAAEEFVAGDPFAKNGVVGAWRVREWRALEP